MAHIQLECSHLHSSSFRNSQTVLVSDNVVDHGGAKFEEFAVYCSSKVRSHVVSGILSKMNEKYSENSLKREIFSYFSKREEEARSTGV